MLAILFVVFWVLALVFHPWPNSPLTGWPWASHLVYMLLFALLGLAVFGLRI